MSGAEAMTPQERMAAVVAGRRPDRVPVFGFVGAYAARLYGLSLKDFYTDIEKCVRVQFLAADLHGYDDAPRYAWADWGGWEFGGTVHFPESYVEFAPRTESHPVSTLADVEHLKTPDPRTAGMYPLLMEYNRIMRRMGLPARIPGGSVTNVVNGIVGGERLLRWYVREPEAVRTLYEKATAFILDAADMIIAEFGAENCVAGFSAPLDSNDLVSPKVFEKFAVLYLKRVSEGLIHRGVKRFGLHICGDHRGNLAAWAALPIPPRTTISIGSGMDIVQVAEAFGHKHVVMGNVSTSLLATGTYEEVYEEARRCIERGKDLPGGFALMPACEAPVTTPPLNIHALVKAVNDCGRYAEKQRW